MADENERPIPPMFIPIAKVDADRREVWGYGAVEEPDQASEILDYASSKPYFERWSNQAQKRSRGQSKGNVREMHRPSAAGKVIAFTPDDARKGFYIGAKIVDEVAWQKVLEGVYTGFSVGGSYIRRWPDHQTPGLVRYTANPGEISVVDSPCISSATFDVIKADSMVRKSFNPGNTGSKIMVIWEDEGEEEELEKISAPAAQPMPLPDQMPIAEGKPDPSPDEITVQQIPPASEARELSAEAMLSQEELMRAANLMMREMKEDVQRMLNNLPDMVAKSVIANLPLVLSDALLFSGVTRADQTGRKIKVIKKE